MAEGRKVSRASGNDVTLRGLMQQGFDGPTVRFWLLATHYRSVLKYSRSELERAAHSVARLREFVARLRDFEPGARSEELDQALYEARMGCQNAMDNDLNVPQGLGKLFAFVRHANRLMNAGQLDAEQVEQILSFMRLVNRIVDVIDFDEEADDPRVQQLVEQRSRARQERDFRRADALRQQLQAMGVELIDGPAGTRWKRKQQSTAGTSST
jgi:cysteinyl-tRNA synthetase